MILSCYLIYRIDNIFDKMISNQKDFSNTVISEIKDIKKDIYEIRIDIASRQD